MATAASRLTALAAHSPPIRITQRRLCGPGRHLGPSSNIIVTKWQLKVPRNGGCAATLFTTYHVPSGTFRAKSGPVFAARTTTTVDLLVAGSAGPNAARIMTKVHDMW